MKLIENHPACVNISIHDNNFSYINLLELEDLLEKSGKEDVEIQIASDRVNLLKRQMK